MNRRYTFSFSLILLLTCYWCKQSLNILHISCCTFLVVPFDCYGSTKQHLIILNPLRILIPWNGCQNFFLHCLWVSSFAKVSSLPTDFLMTKVSFLFMVSSLMRLSASYGGPDGSLFCLESLPGTYYPGRLWIPCYVHMFLIFAHRFVQCL